MKCRPGLINLSSKPSAPYVSEDRLIYRFSKTAVCPSPIFKLVLLSPIGSRPLDARDFPLPQFAKGYPRPYQRRSPTGRESIGLVCSKRTQLFHAFPFLTLPRTGPDNASLANFLKLADWPAVHHARSPTFLNAADKRSGNLHHVRTRPRPGESA